MTNYEKKLLLLLSKTSFINDFILKKININEKNLLNFCEIYINEVLKKFDTSIINEKQYISVIYNMLYILNINDKLDNKLINNKIVKKSIKKIESKVINYIQLEEFKNKKIEYKYLKEFNFDSYFNLILKSLIEYQKFLNYNFETINTYPFKNIADFIKKYNKNETNSKKFIIELGLFNNRLKDVLKTVYKKSLIDIKPEEFYKYLKKENIDINDTISYFYDIDENYFNENFDKFDPELKILIKNNIFNLNTIKLYQIKKYYPNIFYFTIENTLENNSIFFNIFKNLKDDNKFINLLTNFYQEENIDTTLYFKMLNYLADNSKNIDSEKLLKTFINSYQDNNNKLSLKYFFNNLKDEMIFYINENNIKIFKTSCKNYLFDNFEEISKSKNKFQIALKFITFKTDYFYKKSIYNKYEKIFKDNNIDLLKILSIKDLFYKNHYLHDVNDDLTTMFFSYPDNSIFENDINYYQYIKKDLNSIKNYFSIYSNINKFLQGITFEEAVNIINSNKYQLYIKDKITLFMLMTLPVKEKYKFLENINYNKYMLETINKYKKVKKELMNFEDITIINKFIKKFINKNINNEELILKMFEIFKYNEKTIKIFVKSLADKNIFVSQIYTFYIEKNINKNEKIDKKVLNLIINNTNLNIVDNNFILLLQLLKNNINNLDSNKIFEKLVKIDNSTIENNCFYADLENYYNIIINIVDKNIDLFKQLSSDKLKNFFYFLLKKNNNKILNKIFSKPELLNFIDSYFIKNSLYYVKEFEPILDKMLEKNYNTDNLVNIILNNKNIIDKNLKLIKVLNDENYDVIYTKYLKNNFISNNFIQLKGIENNKEKQRYYEKYKKYFDKIKVKLQINTDRGIFEERPRLDSTKTKFFRKENFNLFTLNNEYMFFNSSITPLTKKDIKNYNLYDNLENSFYIDNLYVSDNFEFEMKIAVLKEFLNKLNKKDKISFFIPEIFNKEELKKLNIDNEKLYYVNSVEELLSKFDELNIPKEFYYSKIDNNIAILKLPELKNKKYSKLNNRYYEKILKNKAYELYNEFLSIKKIDNQYEKEDKIFNIYYINNIDIINNGILEYLPLNKQYELISSSDFNVLRKSTINYNRKLMKYIINKHIIFNDINIPLKISINLDSNDKNDFLEKEIFEFNEISLKELFKFNNSIKNYLVFNLTLKDKEFIRQKIIKIIKDNNLMDNCNIKNKKELKNYIKNYKTIYPDNNVYINLLTKKINNVNSEIIKEYLFDKLTITSDIYHTLDLSDIDIDNMKKEKDRELVMNFLNKEINKLLINNENSNKFNIYVDIYSTLSEFSKNIIKYNVFLENLKYENIFIDEKNYNINVSNIIDNIKEKSIIDFLMLPKNEKVEKFIIEYLKLDLKIPEILKLENKIEELLELRKNYNEIEKKLNFARKLEKKEIYSNKLEILNKKKENITDYILQLENKIKNINKYKYKDINLKIEILIKSFLIDKIFEPNDEDKIIDNLKNLKFKDIDIKRFEKFNEIYQKQPKNITKQDYVFIKSFFNDNKKILSFYFKKDIYNTALSEILNTYEKINNFNKNKYYKNKQYFYKNYEFLFYVNSIPNEFEINKNNLEYIMYIYNYDIGKITYFMDNFSNINLTKIKEKEDNIEIKKEYFKEFNGLHLINFDIVLKNNKEFLEKNFLNILKVLKKEFPNDTYEIINLFFDKYNEISNYENNKILTQKEIIGLINNIFLLNSNINDMELFKNLLYCSNSGVNNDSNNKFLNLTTKAEDMANEVSENLKQNEDKEYQEKLPFIFGKPEIQDNKDVFIYGNFPVYDKIVYGLGYATKSCMTLDGVSADILEDASKNEEDWSCYIGFKLKPEYKQKENKKELDQAIEELNKKIEEYNKKLIEQDNNLKHNKELMELRSNIVNDIKKYFLINSFGITWIKGNQATLDNFQGNNNDDVETNNINYHINKIIEFADISTKFSYIKTLKEILKLKKEGKEFDKSYLIDKPFFVSLGMAYTNNTLIDKINKKNRNIKFTNYIKEKDSSIYSDAEQQILVKKHDKYDIDKPTDIIKHFENIYNKSIKDIKKLINNEENSLNKLIDNNESNNKKKDINIDR